MTKKPVDCFCCVWLFIYVGVNVGDYLYMYLIGFSWGRNHEPLKCAFQNQTADNIHRCTQCFYKPFNT